MESIESGQGNSAFALYSRPGRKIFAVLDNPQQNSQFRPHQNRGAWSNANNYNQFDAATFNGLTYFAKKFNFNQQPDINPASWFPLSLANGPVRAELTINGRGFAIGGGMLFEVFADGSVSAIGPVANDGLPATMAASAFQLCVASGGTLYVFDLTTGAFTTPAGVPANPPATVLQVGICDQFFIALDSNGQFQTSNLADATTWNGLNVNAVSVFNDTPNAILIDHRQIWVFGPKNIQPYYDSGDPNTPFQPVPGNFEEQGLIAPASPLRMDNSVFWMGGDERGSGIFWRANGSTPTRVSNHAIEAAWNDRKVYPTIADLITYSYQENGHTFAVLYFPSANKTWVYDAATQQWHERKFLDPNHGQIADRGQCHMVAFGKHLVGDNQAGIIFDTSTAYFDDFGNPIKRFRRAPHISTEQEWMFFNQLQLLMDVGGGVQLFDQNGNPRDALIGLRWSDDAAKTFGNEHMKSFGGPGKTKKRVIWRRMGKSRNRVFEISCSEATFVAIIDAYLQASPGYEPQQRLTTTYSKVT